MDQQKLQELYKLHERAKRMERLGNDDEALNIYLQIHEDFFANTSDLYERPAVILEKKHRFDEAIALCQKAIALIQDDKITGTVEQFEKRIRKIEERMGKSKSSSENTSKENRFDPRNWKTAEWVKATFIILCAGAALFLLLPKESGYEDVYIDMSEMDRESELEGSPFKESEPTDYVITESMISVAIATVTSNADVINASVTTSEDTIGFGIITQPGTTKDRCEALAVDFVKSLSSAAAFEYPDLNGPNALAFGEIYNYYDIVIAVGDTPENIISKGTKNKSSNLINWRD